MPEERAINPYNFIPFGDGPERMPLQSYFQGQMLTGWFDVHLKIKTPLIIPDASNFDEKKVPVQKGKKTILEPHREYDFFQLPNGSYSIPGSTLRGLIRSTYEAATDSCLPFLPKEPDLPISQRTPLYAALKDRGLLEYDSKQRKWLLYSTKKTLIKTTRSEVVDGSFRGYRNGQKVQFQVDDKGIVTLGAGAEEGFLQFNIPLDGTIQNEYHVAILEKKSVVWPDPACEKENQQTQMLYNSLHTSVYDTIGNVYSRRTVYDPRTMQEVLDRYGKPRRYGSKWHEDFEQFILPAAIHHTAAVDLLKPLEDAYYKGRDCVVPCYYFIVGDGDPRLAYLSYAAVGRIRQRRNWAGIMGKHRPCEKQNLMCPACALFGSVQDGGNSGRVRFSDALPGSDCLSPEKVTLPILSTPRTSSFEFYLRKPDANATYWNFDYYGVKSSYTYHKDGENHTVSFTDYRDLPEATPRGRKMYWHGKPQTSSEKSKQNATMEAIESGSFAFRISFDRITRAQLGDLLWCVTLGDNKEKSKYLHKLGHGKPVGYGSVKLFVDNGVHLRTIDPKNGFAVSDEPHDPAEFLNDTERGSALFPNQIETILKMADFYITKDKEVAYLTGYDNRGMETIYSWFQINRVNADDVLTLPEPADEDITLPTRRGKRPDRGSRGPNMPRQNLNRGAGGSRPGQYEQELFAQGTVFHGAVVSGLSGPNVFFKLPGTKISGHYYTRRGEFFNRGDTMTVRIVRYQPNWNNYDVEVVPE